MTPIDDELRRTLRARAGALAPSPDPLAGIERRARRIRRRRGLTAVGTAAAAAAVVAIAVPTVVNGIGPAPRQVTSPSTSPMASPGSAVLDPADPWALRGDETLLGDGTLDSVRREWGKRHVGSRLTPLFVQTWDPSGLVEIAFVASDDDTMRVGWVVASESGPEFLHDTAATPEHAYQFALPGDEGVTRLYVVAAPSSRVLYAADGSTYRDVTQRFRTHTFGLSERSTTDAGGVGVIAVESSGGRVRVEGIDGTVLYEAPAGGSASQPANVLDWPARGDAAAGPSVHDLEVAFTRENGRTDGARVHYRPLFTGDTDSGVRFTIGQAWFEGMTWAATVLYSVAGSERGVLEQYVSPDGPAVVAGLLTDLPGTSVDLLVVVPRPETGQVSYAPGSTGAFRPVAGQDHLDGVVLVDRAKDASGDRLEVLDGHGDLDAPPLYRGSVERLLCPDTGCN